jgi:hypothetical protein
MPGFILNFTLSQELANHTLEKVLENKNLDSSLLRIFFREKKVVLKLHARKAFRIFPVEKITLGLLLRDFSLTGKRCSVSFKSSSATINLLLSLVAPLIRKMLFGFEYRVEGKELLFAFDVPENFPRIEKLRLELADREMRLFAEAEPDDPAISGFVSKLCGNHRNAKDKDVEFKASRNSCQ